MNQVVRGVVAVGAAVTAVASGCTGTSPTDDTGLDDVGAAVSDVRAVVEVEVIPESEDVHGTVVLFQDPVEVAIADAPGVAACGEGPLALFDASGTQVD
ncbi:MAG: hypothetical protein ABMB14_39200, partial [Myxococcota bacterium]